MKIDSFQTLRMALDCMHQKYRVRHVLLTSVSLDVDNHIRAPNAATAHSQPMGNAYACPKLLYAIASTYDDSTCCMQSESFAFSHVEEHFSGVGDLLAALTLGYYRQSCEDASHKCFVDAASAAIFATQSVLIETARFASKKGRKDRDRKIDIELRVLNSIDVIRNGQHWPHETVHWDTHLK